MSSNKKAKEKLIQLYGPECFIDKLHLRKDKQRIYTGKSQMKRMKQLTYHHIREKSKGGKATVENGALLSVENHEWFNRQSKEKQAEMNKKFQEYKKCKIQLVDELQTDIQPLVIQFTPEELFQELPKEKYNRAKEKAKLKKLKLEYEDR